MIQSVLDNKVSLSHFFAESFLKLENLSSYNWVMLEQLEEVMKPLEETTKSVEKNDSLISDVLPILKLLHLNFEKPLINECPDINKLR